MFYHFFWVLCFIVFLGVLCFIIFIGFCVLSFFFVQRTYYLVIANQELATRTRQDDIQNLIHHVLAMHRLAPKLVPELLRDEHRDRAVFQPSSSGVEVVVDEVLVGSRTKLLGAPRNRSPIDESTSLLVRLEDDEELAHHANPLALVVLHLPGREIAELAHRLALELVDVLHVVHPVIMGRLVVRVGLLIVIVGTLTEPGVATGLAATIRSGTLHVERRSQHPRTLAAIAVAHLAANRLENLVVGQLRRHLDDDRADLEAAGRRVDVAKHLLVRRLRHINEAVAVVIDLAPEHRRSIGEDASRDVVGVGDADAAVTIGDPEASLRDDSVRTIVCGERHCEFVSKVC